MVDSVSSLGGTLTPDDPARLSTIRRYEERLARDPMSLVFAPLADAYRKAGRTQDAIRLCREGLARFPQYVTARLILAKALLEVLGASGSVLEGSALKQQLTDDTFVTMTFGTVCLEQGLVDEAVQIFLRLLGRDLADVRARQGLEEALLVKTQRRKGP